MEPRARVSFLACAVLLTGLALAGLLRATAATSESPRAHTVVIEGMTFTPARVRIAAGDHVVFENRDILPHTATAKDASAFDSGLIKPGESWTYKSSGPKTILYLCSYHPTMEGRIVIE